MHNEELTAKIQVTAKGYDSTLGMNAISIFNTGNQYQLIHDITMLNIQLKH